MLLEEDPPRTLNLMDALISQIGQNGDMEDNGTTVKNGQTEVDKMDDNFLYLTLKTGYNNNGKFTIL